MADVICPNCSGRHHSTTAAFKLGEVTTGNMLTLKQFYKDNGWSSFPEDVGMQFGDLECPGCGGSYSDDGRVKVDMEQHEEDMANAEPPIACPVCQKVCSSQSGLKRHAAAMHPETWG